MTRILFLNSDCGLVTSSLLSDLAEQLTNLNYTLKIHELRCRYIFDPAVLVGTYQHIIRFQPQIIHAFGQSAEWLGFLSKIMSTSHPPTLVFSRLQLSVPRTAISSIFASLITRSANLVVQHDALISDASYSRITEPRRRIEMPPGLLQISHDSYQDNIRTKYDIPIDARIIVVYTCDSDVASAKTAIWAFDILRYIHSDIYLVLAGSRVTLRQVERFACQLAFDDNRVKVVPSLDDLMHVLPFASVAWIYSGHDASQMTLQCMSNKVPVILARLARLDGLVTHDLNGLLFADRDPVQLAKLTQELLIDSQKRCLITESAAQRVTEFSRERLLDRFRRLYDDLVRS